MFPVPGFAAGRTRVAVRGVTALPEIGEVVFGSWLTSKLLQEGEGERVLSSCLQIKELLLVSNLNLISTLNPPFFA